MRSVFQHAASVVLLELEEGTGFAVLRVHSEPTSLPPRSGDENRAALSGHALDPTLYWPIIAACERAGPRGGSLHGAQAREKPRRYGSERVCREWMRRG